MPNASTCRPSTCSVQHGVGHSPKQQATPDVTRATCPACNCSRPTLLQQLLMCQQPCVAHTQRAYTPRMRTKTPTQLQPQTQTRPRAGAHSNTRVRLCHPAMFPLVMLLTTAYPWAAPRGSGLGSRHTTRAVTKSAVSTAAPRLPSLPGHSSSKKQPRHARVHDNRARRKRGGVRTMGVQGCVLQKHA
jgi:hypothetical protein